MRFTASTAVRFGALAAVIALGLFEIRAGASIPLKSGVDLSDLDRTCKPCDDFYQFANGGWIKGHPIPASQPQWGSFNILAENNRKVLHDLLDSASTANAASGTNEQKIGDFYASCMDVAAID